ELSDCNSADCQQGFAGLLPVRVADGEVARRASRRDGGALSAARSGRRPTAPPPLRASRRDGGALSAARSGAADSPPTASRLAPCGAAPGGPSAAARLGP